MTVSQVQSEEARRFLKSAARRADEALHRHLPPESEVPSDLYRAVRYSVFAGGKRVRPALALASFEACGGTGENIYYATTALEILHTFSLIHDDLPCMDDDDYRRGKPTNHKVFGEAIAVLSDDFLCAYAFEMLGKAQNPDCITTLASATRKMLAGQVMDILSEEKQVSLDSVQFIHENKTAALIEASILMGAQMAGVSRDVLEGLRRYGNKIGLAFQIVDDVLDIEQTTENLGKDSGSDQAKGKATYPSVIGLEQSKQLARDLADEAVDIVSALPIKPGMLCGIAELIVTRVN